MRIAIAWELGGGFGHAVRVAAVSRALIEEVGRAGVSVFARSPQRIARLGPMLPVRPAPHVRLSRPAGETGGTVWRGPARSYPQNLRIAGYADPDLLSRGLGAWIEALRGHDLVAAQFAPTALLAARCLGLPTVAFGHGFDTPPHVAPMPAFHPDQPPAEGFEHAVLRCVNRALRNHGGTPGATFAHAFAKHGDVLMVAPELDHYPDSTRARAPRAGAPRAGARWNGRGTAGARCSRICGPTRSTRLTGSACARLSPAAWTRPDRSASRVPHPG